MNNPNKNSENNQGFFNRHPIVGKVAAGAVLGTVGLGIAHHIDSAPEAPQEKGMEMSMPGEITPTLHKELVLFQADADGDHKIAPTDIPDVTWKPTEVYTITVENGAIQDAIKAYEEKHNTPVVRSQGDTEEYAIPGTIVDALNDSGNSFVERARAEGGDGVIQPGTRLTVTEFTDENGYPRAIISNDVVIDTN